MTNLRNTRIGLLETTLLEFKQRGNSSLEDIRVYLYERYRLTVSNSVLRKRLDSLSFK